MMGRTTILRCGGSGGEKREKGRRNQETIEGRTLRVIGGGITWQNEIKGGKNMKEEDTYIKEEVGESYVRGNKE